jgi:EAL domain-containing protein (putative c-di-GMP-specific phosphodiesterase class I)
VHVIAEGIETPEHLAVVRELGVQLGQGYLWSVPAEPPPGGTPYSGALELGRL